MSLIKCPECGKEISDVAKQCPHCGFPIVRNVKEPSVVKENVQDKNVERVKRKKALIVAGIIMLVILIGLGVYWILNGTEFGGGKYNDFVITTEFTNKVNSLNIEEADDFQEGLAPVKIGEKWGFMDNTGELVIPAQFDEVNCFQEDLAPVKKDGKWGYINKQGNIVIPLQFEGVRPFSNGLAAISKNGDIEYEDHICAGSDLYFLRASSDGEIGFIDKKGNIVIPEKYQYVTDFSEEFAAFATNDDVFGYINKKGEVVIPAKYRLASVFREGLAFVYNNGHFDFIDTKGNVMFSKGGLPAKTYREDLSACDGGFIDKKGKQVIEITDGRDICSFNDGCAVFKNRDGWGAIDKKGNLIVPTQYDFILGFSEGLSAVCKDGKWGYVDKKGETAISMQFDEATSFSEGLAVIKKDGYVGFIDRHGNSTITDEYVQKRNEEKRKEEERRHEEERKQKVIEILQWLQGNWEWNGTIDGYRNSCRLGVSDDYAVLATPRGVLDQGKITIDFGDNTIHFGSTYINFDYKNGRLGDFSNGMYYKKMSGNSGSSLYNNPSNNFGSDSRLMTKFNKLNEEGRKLIGEIEQYYRTGQAGPWVITDVYRLKSIQDEKISLAQEMGDKDLERLCRQQKAQTIAALRQMGF